MGKELLYMGVRGEEQSFQRGSMWDFPDVPVIDVAAHALGGWEEKEKQEKPRQEKPPQ